MSSPEIFSLREIFSTVSLAVTFKGRIRIWQKTFILKELEVCNILTS